MKLYTCVAWFTRIYFLLFLLGGYFLWQHPVASAELAYKEYWHWRHSEPIPLVHWQVAVPGDLITAERDRPFSLSLHRALKPEPYISVYVKPGAFQLTAFRDIYASKGYEQEDGKACLVSEIRCERWRKSYMENNVQKQDIKVIIAAAKTIVWYAGSSDDEKYLEELLKGMAYQEKKPVT